MPVVQCAAGVPNMSIDMLDKLRLYLTATRQIGTASFTISEAGRKHAEADFVACRKADRRIKPDDLHRWLTVSRLLALSHGEKELTAARWEQMKQLEAARLQRVQG
eukprot:SAG31_NODE_564_length_14059_cov_5.728940_9_plen_106_part_00